MNQEIHLKHETHRHIFIKFFFVLFFFVGYFAFVSIKYGSSQGFLIAWLTWSFFVLCTPIADAGFLIDFPIRLVLHIRMLISEMFVWVTAISLNTYFFFVKPEVYEKTPILSLFKHIIGNPFPFWFIIMLSASGTFLSVRFGDELLDVKRHKDRNYHRKHKRKSTMIILAFIFTVMLISYDLLLKNLKIKL